ncbi:hypothetical protein HNQ71_002720 [Mesorhizobium sangaii]|uniref:Uncharacterized protein n=1 Tax=Mesorhizobium sangaii TaxID=505389 RepID=A0A841PNN8_9HYPH|nr:hypothetical protein [Mesorhizobium sangaii]
MDWWCRAYDSALTHMICPLLPNIRPYNLQFDRVRLRVATICQRFRCRVLFAQIAGGGGRFKKG